MGIFRVCKQEVEIRYGSVGAAMRHTRPFVGFTAALLGDFHLERTLRLSDPPSMETVDPRTMPRAIHVVPRNGKWRVRWSDHKKALRVLPSENAAINLAIKNAAGRFSVIVHKPSGYVDPQRSILLWDRKRPKVTGR